jgi:hypothetical protein
MDRKPEGCASHISEPWKGSRYEDLRLMVIGVNLNGHGGLGAITKLVTEAQSRISSGARRINFGNSAYKGTPLWHAVGCYAALFAEQEKLMNVTRDQHGIPLDGDASRAYDYIAYTNHVKCSPTNNHSRPTNAMWSECGRHVLREEIGILDPKNTLLLGIENYKWFIANFSDSLEQRKTRGSIRRATVDVGSRHMQLWGVPHPSRGAPLSVLPDLRSILQMD